MILDISSLKRNELFESLTEEELAQLVPLCSDFVAVEEAFLFREGRAASRLYLVADGRIALQKGIRAPHGKRARRTTIAVCWPGEAIGWSALVEPYEHTLSAVAWDSSRLISIDAKKARNVLDLYPDVGYKVMTALSTVTTRRLTQLTEALGRELSYAAIRV